MAKKSPKEGKDRKKTGHKSAKSGKGKKHREHHKNKHRKTVTSDDEMPSMSANIFQVPPEVYQPTTEEVSAYTATTGDFERSSKKGSERGSKKESTLVFVAPTAYEDDDKEKDTSSTGRFCILLGALGIMAMMVYFVLHLYQWVGPAEMIIVGSSTATPSAENTASTTGMSHLA